MTPLLEVVRAGAGAGKTYDLCQTVAEAVEKGLDPARILATTLLTRMLPSIGLALLNLANFA